MPPETTILAVDDTPATLMLLTEMLSAGGFEVRTAASGKLALAAIATSIPDLVLLDIRMPGIGGIEVCRRLKADPATRAIPIILLSASADTEEWAEGLQLGAADYILKPDSPEELLHRVRTQLALVRAQQQHSQMQELQATNVGLSVNLRTVEQDRALLRDALDKAEQMRKALLSVLEDQRQAETALRESQGRFQIAMDASQDGLWDWDITTGEVYYSPAYFLMLGYPPNQLPANVSTWGDLIHPDDRERANAINNDCIENRQSRFEVEFRMRAQDGTWRWVLGRGKAVARDAQSRALRMVGTHTDITQRKASEVLLREQLSELQRWQAVMLDREDRVLELKAEVNELLLRQGQPARYSSQMEGSAK